MSASLVGSEMCIRDRRSSASGASGKYGRCLFSDAQAVAREMELRSSASGASGKYGTCLFSDA
eukprot:10886111-Alexandrium_andersonii.AAC.1